MKKSLLGSVLLVVLMGVSSAKSYECKRYENREYAGFVKVRADSESEAVQKALEKYKKMNRRPFTNLRVDAIKCERSTF